MNGQHIKFVPEQIKAVKPSPEIVAKLAQLRAEALARSQALMRKAPHVFKPTAH